MKHLRSIFIIISSVRILVSCFLVPSGLRYPAATAASPPVEPPFVAAGADRTTVWPIVKGVAEKNRLGIEADPRAYLGTFYRSDHFSFAQAGVPAFSVASGTKITGKPTDFASKAINEFNEKTYHSPQDDLKPEWDFSGFAVLARFALD